MIIIGSKGFAKEILEIFLQNNKLNDIAFFDNVSLDLPKLLYGNFPIITNTEGIIAFFEKNGRDYCIGVGNPKVRYKLSNFFDSFGGNLCSVISPYARIGGFGTEYKEGVNIMTGTVVTNDVKIGKGVLINLNCTIGHDTIVGDFTEISPGAHISGNCNIGDFVTIGTGAVILPNIIIGNGSVIAAGAIVTKNVDANTMVAGVPATLKKVFS